MDFLADVYDVLCTREIIIDCDVSIKPLNL